jgi:hypothetical protein
VKGRRRRPIKFDPHLDSPISFTPFSFFFFLPPFFFTARERGKGGTWKTLYNTNPTTPRQQEETLAKLTNKMVKRMDIVIIIIFLFYFILFSIFIILNYYY